VCICRQLLFYIHKLYHVKGYSLYEMYKLSKILTWKYTLYLDLATAAAMAEYQSCIANVLLSRSFSSLMNTEYKSRILECTISLRFLDIIFRVLRLEVSVWISLTIGKVVWFSIRFSSLLLFSV